MPRGWEGNRRSGGALAMRHVLSGLSTCGLSGQHMGDEHPAYAPNGARPGLPFEEVIPSFKNLNFYTESKFTVPHFELGDVLSINKHMSTPGVLAMCVCAGQSHAGDADFVTDNTKQPRCRKQLCISTANWIHYRSVCVF